MDSAILTIAVIVASSASTYVALVLNSWRLG
jgi:hypothetical protein